MEMLKYVAVGLIVGAVTDWVATQIVPDLGWHWREIIRGFIVGAVVAIIVSLQWKASLQRRIAPELWLSYLIVVFLAGFYLQASPRLEKLAAWFPAVGFLVIVLLGGGTIYLAGRGYLRSPDALQVEAQRLGIELSYLEDNLPKAVFLLGKDLDRLRKGLVKENPSSPKEEIIGRLAGLCKTSDNTIERLLAHYEAHP